MVNWNQQPRQDPKFSKHIFDASNIESASMPGLVRKIVIFAAVDGLILQPLAQRGQRPALATKIGWDSGIGPALKDGVDGGSSGKGFEVFGIVGEC